MWIVDGSIGCIIFLQGHSKRKSFGWGGGGGGGGDGSGTALLGGSGGMPPKNTFEIRIFEIGFPDFWE